MVGLAGYIKGPYDQHKKFTTRLRLGVMGSLWKQDGTQKLLKTLDYVRGVMQVKWEMNSTS